MATLHGAEQTRDFFVRGPGRRSGESFLRQGGDLPCNGGDITKVGQLASSSGFFGEGP